MCTGTILSIKKALDIGISLSLTCIPRYSETCCNQAEEDNNKVFILIGPVQHHSLLYCGCIVTISTDLAYILTETKINLRTLLYMEPVHIPGMACTVDVELMVALNQNNHNLHNQICIRISTLSLESIQIFIKAPTISFNNLG